MNTVHTLREYVDALRDAGILVESTVSDELAAREIHCLTYDTRALSEDALFICKGAHFKEEYLCDALSRGAIAYVAEKKHNVDAPCLLVNDIRYSLVVLGQLFYNHVTDKLTSVGITGTKGKSTTAYYVRYILNDWLRAQSMPECAILSSIDNYDGKSTEESHITTPEVLELYQHFENTYESGISHLVMEASSQALKYGRVRGITYDVAAFLNIGSDHISPIEHPRVDHNDGILPRKVAEEIFCKMHLLHRAEKAHADAVEFDLKLSPVRGKGLHLVRHIAHDVAAEAVRRVRR